MELNLHTRYYYNTLGGTEREFYLFLIERLARRELEFNIFRDGAMPRDVSERGGLPTFVANDPYDLFYNMAPIVYEWLLLDFPELYYMEGKEFTLDRERGYAIIGDGTLEYTPDEIEEYNAELESIVHRFDGITDDYELELAVNDFITESFEYDFEQEKEGREFNELFTVVGLLKKKKAVCEAYTDLAQLILQRHGIPCAHLVGMAGKEGSKDLHAWLAVKIKGSYYHLDVTFNDANGDITSPGYMYFNLTDDEIRADHEFVSEYHPGIVCNSREYNYYVKSGLHFTTCAEVEEYVRSLCDGAHTSGEQAVYYFRTARELSADDVNDSILRSLHGIRDHDAYYSDGGYYTLCIKF